MSGVTVRIWRQGVMRGHSGSPDTSCMRGGLLTARRLWRAQRAGLAVFGSALLIAAVAAAVVEVRGHGRSSGRSPVRATGWSWQQLDVPDQGFAVRYPTLWSVADFTVDAGYLRSLALFSTTEMSDPCHSSGGLTTCRSYAPVTRLPADGLAVSWYLDGFPRTRGDPPPIDSAPGQNIKIDGYPARLDVGAPTELCSSIGGARSIEAAVQVGSRYFTMSACVAAENHDDSRVLKSLESATFKFLH